MGFVGGWRRPERTGMLSFPVFNPDWLTKRRLLATVMKRAYQEADKSPEKPEPPEPPEPKEQEK